jgi:AP endonuclease-2
MDDVVTINNEKVHLRDIMNPPGVFKDGERLQPIPTKATIPFSARLLPEFNVGTRQNIKDMFKRQPSNTQKTGTVSTPKLTEASSPPKSMPTETASLLELSTQTSTASSSTIQSPSKINATKRKLPEKNSSKGKKAKQTGTAPSPSKKGQGTLRAFFQPKATAAPALLEEVVARSRTSTYTATLDHVPPGDEDMLTTNAHFADNDMNSDDLQPPEESSDDTHVAATTTPDEEDAINLNEVVEKRINSSAQWGQLMRKPKIPLCEDHDEPCKQFQTKKKGANCGRIFYICARPLGPSGEKERNTQWRCRTFIWASDWQGGAGGGS